MVGFRRPAGIAASGVCADSPTGLLAPLGLSGVGVLRSMSLLCVGTALAMVLGRLRLAGEMVEIALKAQRGDSAEA